jgi:hypothetical protein
MDQLRRDHPAALFFIGIDFNANMRSKASVAAQGLGALASKCSLKIITPEAPLAGSPADFFLTSKELTQPGSKCIVLPESEHSVHVPVTVTLRWPALPKL